MINKALEAYYRGNFSNALNLFLTILANDVNNSINYYNVALCYESLNEYELALACYKKSIRLEGTNIRAINNVARMYIDIIKDFDTAEIYLNNAIEIAPKDAEAYNLFGNLLMMKKEYELAVRYLKKSIFLDEKFFKNYYDIAIAYYALEDKQSAKINLEKAISLNNNFLKAQELLQEITE